MAFADPQSVTINAVPFSLPRIGSGLTSGAFQSTGDPLVKLSVSHATNNRARHVLRVDHSKNAADPLNPTTNLPYNMGCYLVVDVPLFGYTQVEQKQVVDGFVAYLTASSGARVTQLLGSES